MPDTTPFLQIIISAVHKQRDLPSKGIADRVQQKKTAPSLPNTEALFTIC